MRTLCASVLFSCVALQAIKARPQREFNLRKFLSIFLLSLYIFGATDAYQLLKIPLFIQHYKCHKSQNPELTIAGFFQIHYNDGPLVIDEDFQQDMQLPFKTTQVAFSQVLNIIVPPHPSFAENALREKAVVYNAYVERFDLKKAVYSIFQPPRFC